jgi:adenylate kinase family enzyme
MKRVVVVGPGAAGKSTLAARLGQITRLPVIELDELFWRPGLAPTPQEEWAVIQRRLAAQESWIMDGDLGPYDVINVRLHAADAIVFLDFSPFRCAWRAIRRSQEQRLLEVAALVPPPQPPGTPAGDRRTRRRCRPLRPADPARSGDSPRR